MTTKPLSETIVWLEQELEGRDRKIAELDQVGKEQRSALEQLQRELEEWKRGHRIRDRKRRAR